jgi:N-acetylglucosaminyldiphosphoundecaprenol N-acetyl-beta-D-mannosaminyltransferase
MTLVRTSAWYFGGRIVPAMIGVLGVSLYTHLLDPRTIGTNAVLISIALFSALGFSWVRVALFRTLGASEEISADVVRTAVVCFAATAFPICVLEACGLFAYDRSIAIGAVALTLFATIASACFELNITLLQARRATAAYGLVNLVRAVLTLGTTLAFVSMGVRANAVLASFALGNCAFVLTLYAWTSAGRGTFDRLLTREFFRFGWPSMVTGSLTQLSTVFDRVVLAFCAGSAAVGVYAVSFDFSRQTIFLVIAATAVAGQPLAMRLVDNGGKESAREQLATNVSLMLAAAIPTVTAIAVLWKPIAATVLGSRFREDAAFAFLMIALATAMTAMRTFYWDQAFELARRTRPQAVISAAAAAGGLMCSAILIPRFGAIGAATSSVTSAAIGIVASVVWGRRVFSLPLPVSAWGNPVVATVVMVAVLRVCPAGAGVLHLALLIAVGGIVYCLALGSIVLAGRLATLAPDTGVPMPCLPYRSHDVFGAKLTPTTSTDLLAILEYHVRSRSGCVIASQNLHGMKVMLDDPEFRALHERSDTYVHVDGMPLIALCRLAGVRATRAQRVTLVDWVWPLLALAAANRWRVFYVGSTRAVIERGLEAIRRRLPDLEIAGYDGFFDIDDPAQNAAVVAGAVAFKPDLVLVGMGMGRQERWILRNRASFARASVCTVGACLEYVAGAVRTPPRWIGHVGLEWLFRLVENPRRFGHRYLVEPWRVLAHVAAYSSERTHG